MPHHLPRKRPHGGHLLGAVLGAVLLLGSGVPAVVQAAEPEERDARSLYEEGRARYETLDYDGAIDLWTQAYAQVPPTEANRDIRNSLVYNIAAAQEKAFELDGKVVHLTKARGLLQRYMDEYKEMYKPTPEARAEIDAVKKRIAELDAKIAAAETAPAPTTAGTPQPAAAPAPVDPRVIERQRQRDIKIETRRLLSEDPEISRLYSQGKGFVGGGAAMLAVGGVAALVGLTWASIDGATAARDRRNRVGGYTTMGLGLGLIGGGVALVVIGSKKRKEAKLKAAEKAEQIVVLPAFGPDGAGLALAGRF